MGSGPETVAPLVNARGWSGQDRAAAPVNTGTAAGYRDMRCVLQPACP